MRKITYSNTDINHSGIMLLLKFSFIWMLRLGHVFKYEMALTVSVGLVHDAETLFIMDVTGGYRMSSGCNDY